MAGTKAASVAEYIDALPGEQREAVRAVRKVILDNLPKGFTETVGFGMINYGVPLSRFPDTYNGQPLCYAALAAQKNYCSVYLMRVYGDPRLAAWFRQEFARAGKKLDMGKSCVRFRRADDLPLGAIGTVIGGTSVDQYIDFYRSSRKQK